MPCDYKNYPSNWKTEIRPRILKRAGEVRDKDGKIIKEARCEFCSLPNKMLVSRNDEYGLVKDMYNGPVYKLVDGKYQKSQLAIRLSEWYGADDIRIVLTIAHLDHDTTNNEDSNLKALCQKCHNNYDSEYRKVNRKNTNTKKKGLQSLFK